MIRRLLASFGRGARPAVAVAKSASNVGRKAILIIDDNAEQLHAMCLALGGKTYLIERADTAESAIRKLSVGHPDLILLDSRVPAADGTQLAHRLLGDEELASVPIVALTELVLGPHGESEGRYDGLIHMPIDPSAFAGQVRGYLESSSQGAEHPSAAVELRAMVGVDRRKDAASLLDAIEEGWPESQFARGTQDGLHRLVAVVGGLRHGELAGYLQRAAGLSNARTVRARSRFRSIIRICRELVERDPEVDPGLADLRAGYLDHLQSNLYGLERALKNGDFATVRKAGHNLKGTGAAYGFAEITDIGRSLEVAAIDGDAAAVEMLLDRIDAYLGIVRPSPNTEETNAAGI